MIGEYFDPRKEFGKAVTELAREDERIVVLSADSGKSSGFTDFMKEFPDRYFECGIMEQGVVGMAAGLATCGKVPIFCAIAPFVTARPFEMVRNDLGYMRQNVKIVGRNSGMTYSDLGATHQSLDDFAIMKSIPGMVVLAPQDPTEIRAAVKAMVEHDGPVYMRIGNPKIPELFEEEPFEIGSAKVLHEGADITLVSTGSATLDALEAAKQLEEEGISVDLIGMPTVYPPDLNKLHASAQKTHKVMTVEEHYVSGGMGSVVTELFSDEPDIRVRRMGMPNDYAITCGDYRQLVHYYGLDAEGISGSIKDFLRQ